MNKIKIVIFRLFVINYIKLEYLLHKRKSVNQLYLVLEAVGNAQIVR